MMSSLTNEGSDSPRRAEETQTPNPNDILNQLVVVFKRNGQQAIGRVVTVEKQAGMYWFSGLRLIVASMSPDGQGRTSLIPYFPPYVVPPDGELVPIEAEAIELILTPQPQLEAAWVQSTSRIHLPNG